MITMLHPNRLESAKKAFVTRRVPLDALKGIDWKPDCLVAGDVVIARVDKIGQHQRLELPTGRRAKLEVGDEVIVACGARYAPDQFHALVPERAGTASLVAAGGIAGLEIERHARMKEATALTIVGRLVDRDRNAVNLASFGLRDSPDRRDIPVVLVAGTSMNSGKTATCGALIQGFRGAGMRVAYVKATGTGSGGDIWTAVDAGAATAMDFTDAGLATTYQVDPELLVDKTLQLVAAAGGADCDRVVVEIADGILQPETAALLSSRRLREKATAIVLAATDSMGAVAAHAWLKNAGYNVAATTGAFTQAPLAMQEFAAASGHKASQLSELSSGAIAHGLGPIGEKLNNAMKATAVA